MLVYVKIIEPEKGGTYQGVHEAVSTAEVRKHIGWLIDKTPQDLSGRLTTKELKPKKGFDYDITPDLAYTNDSESKFLEKLLKPVDKPLILKNKL